MKQKNIIDIQALEDEAKNSEHKESFRELEKSHNYRIGVGARSVSSNQLSYFIEVVIYFCPGPGIDASLMEKNLMLIKELEANGYSLNSDDDSCIYSETTVDAQRLNHAYEKIRSIIKKCMD